MQEQDGTVTGPASGGDSVPLDGDQVCAVEVARGLRAIAAMVDAYPRLAGHVAVGFDPQDVRVPVMYTADPGGVLATFVTAAARFGAQVTKNPDDNYQRAVLRWGPVGFYVYLFRDQVCERVVVGTEQVTKRVKDPAQLAAVPEVEVTETVERVEWVCRPLLAADEGTAGAVA